MAASTPDRTRRTGGDGLARERIVGKPRGIGFAILVTVVTLGIYSLYWTYVTFNELRAHRGEGMGGGLAVVLHLLMLPLRLFGVPSFVAFLAPAYVGRMYREDEREPPVTGHTGWWVFLDWITLVVGSIVWFVKVQESLNRYWLGATPPAETSALYEYGHKECPRCGAFSADDATHCRTCRQPLPAGSMAS